MRRLLRVSSAAGCARALMWLVVLAACSGCGLFEAKSGKSGSAEKGALGSGTQGSANPGQPGDALQNPNGDDLNAMVVNDPVLDAQVSLQVLPESRVSNRQHRYLDALALTRVYSRVFPVRLNRNRAQNGCGGHLHSFCASSLFTISEAADLKSLHLAIPQLSEFDRSSGLSLNYFRALRAMLARECRLLVDAEWETIDTPNEHVLVFRKENPQIGDLVSFASRLHGLPAGISGVSEAFQLQGYLDAFAMARKEALEERQKAALEAQNSNSGNNTTESFDVEMATAALKDAYVALCMALGSDPVLYLY